MEFNQAEKLKRERGKATGDDSFNKSLSSALGDLVGEIRLSFDYYENQALEKNIGHVFLTGGSSLLPELDHFLSETLGLKVSTWNPFEGLKIGEGVKEWERVSPAMAVSLGLALHEE
jgi:type IV pilus assembly protein PilM